MTDILLVIALSLIGVPISLFLIWLGWVVVGTIADIRKARRMRARAKAVEDATGWHV